jgi:CubicO group peptidase (beta-lactamase class C family)
MKHYTFAVLSFLLLASHSSVFSQLTAHQVDSLVYDAMKQFGVAGAAVGIVKDGKVFYTKGFGVGSVETNTPVNAHTNFAIASNTKAFTAAALAILMDEGKLTWKDRVKDYIPEFKMYDPYVTEHFLIEDLLTHRSGLGLGAGDLMFFPDGSDFTIHDVLTNFQYFEPVSEFRTKFDYDNLLYFVAGEVIARVSGMSWEDFVKPRILDPLGMERSYCSFQQMSHKTNLANPHSTESGEVVEIPHFKKDATRINGAAGAIYSNVDDLCQWMLVQLNQGSYGPGLEQQLFSERRQQEMWRIHTVLPTHTGERCKTHFSGYGLGWDLRDILGNLSVSHTGGLPGMLSKTWLIPDLELGVVVLTNTDPGGSPMFAAVTQTIVDSYLGLEDGNWTAKYLAQFQHMQSADKFTVNTWKVVEAADDSHIDPDDYTGTYVDKWFGKAEIKVKDGGLWFHCVRSPRLSGPMAYYKANTFAIKWEYQDMNADAFAMFRLDEEGKAQGIRMKGISPNIDFSFDFQDLDFVRE